MAGYEVRVADAPEVLMAAARGRANSATISTRIIELLDQVYAFLKASGTRHRGINIAVYNRGGSESLSGSGQGFAMEAGVEVEAAFQESGGILCTRTPTGPAVTVTHIGPYNLIPQAHNAIQSWAREQGRCLTTINGEIYGHWTDDPKALRTDVWYQLAP